MVIDMAGSALIEVDVQNDFCPAYTTKDGKERPPGALAVSQGHEVIKPLNMAAEKFAHGGAKIIASQDWHPAHHSSFASSHPGKQVNDIIVLPVPPIPAPAEGAETESAGEFMPAAIQQVLWPDHCVQGSKGAQFHDDLNLAPVNFILRKGYRRDLDSYSVFFENDRHTPTGLDGLLRGLSITQIFIGGLATDYCVYYSVMDAIRLGYKTVVLTDAVCGVDIPEGSVERAFDMMRKAGAVFMNSRELG
jgi:nicotinamidase/pyrazinamidase